ncbi:MAG: DUF418 domain-containing protein [Leptospira sp.]|nr:DUF418 domain-containing protein [Leptospira sp.]
MNQSERLQYLDLLRGFAIFGILVSNLPMIAEPPFGIGLNNSEYSLYILGLIYFFVTGKFFVIFSFVFGYGFTILLNSLEKKGIDSKNIFYRRLMGLAMLGVFHAIFFFNGDILVTYAILGYFLYKFKDSSDGKILKTGFSFWILSAILYAVMGLLIYFASTEETNTSLELTKLSIQGYLGNFASSTMQRLEDLTYTFPFILLFNWSSAFMMFLLGLWMGRKKILQNPDDFFNRFKGYWISIFTVGCISNGLYVWGNLETFNIFHSLITNSLLALGGISFALVYCYGLYLFSKSENNILTEIKNSIATVGTMSLTNYLMHSILLAWIFNGWGFGYYGQLAPEVYMLLVFPIYGVNIGFSVFWKRYFSMGPFEIILRKFTYGKSSN